jgi:hypothetical protein
MFLLDDENLQKAIKGKNFYYKDYYPEQSKLVIVILLVFGIMGWLAAFYIAANNPPQCVISKEPVPVYEWDQINQKRGKQIEP